MKQLLIAVLAITLCAQSSQAEEWTSLFNKKDLSGWIQKNGTAKYVVKGNTIVGTTNEGSPNSFLCSEKLYGNFELEFEVKCDNALNSGVQIRSKTKPVPNDSDVKFGRVFGPQVEIEASGDK